MAFLSRPTARNSDQYVAYTFPIADAREKDLVFILSALLPNRLKPLDALSVAPLVRPNPADRFASASVIRIMFPLTFGAFERVVNNSFRFFASRGMLFTALPDATLPSLPMAVTICERLVISKLNEPILFICRTKFCNCAEIVGRFFVACVDALPPILDRPAMRLDSPDTSKFNDPTLFMPVMNCCN